MFVVASPHQRTKILFVPLGGSDNFGAFGEVKPLLLRCRRATPVG